jgi:predicted nucleic acid-binding protein
MPDKTFIDTNILIYGFSSDEPQKRAITTDLSGQSDLVISTQVLLEVSNVLKRITDLNWTQISQITKSLSADFYVHVNTESTILDSEVI